MGGRSEAVHQVATPRLILRPFVPRDVRALHGLFVGGGEHLDRWLPRIPKNGAAVARYISWTRNERERGRRYTFGSFHEKELIGGAELVIQDDGTAQVGYWLGEAHTGHGFATEAAAALARAAIFAHGVRRVELRIAAANDASLRVAERLGCRFEAAADEVVVGVLDGDLLAGRALGDLDVEIVDRWGRSPGAADGSAPTTAERAWSQLRRAVARRLGGLEISAELIEAGGAPCVSLTAPFATEGAVPAWRLLQHNAELAIGAVSIAGGLCAIRHVAPLAWLDVEEVTRAIELLDEESYRLAREVPTTDCALFSCFAD